MVQDPLWETPHQTITITPTDEGEQALSHIFHQVRELQNLRVSDPLDEAPERLEAIHEAARCLRAYISGLRAR